MGRAYFLKVLLALALGAVGGVAFFLLKLPLAWMLGAMCFTTVAAIAGAPIAFSLPLRSGMVAVLGALLGSAFTPDVLARMSQWLGGVAVTALFVAGVTALGVVYFIRIGGFGRATAFFSATPGGLGEMTIIGELYGGDPRIMPLVHAMRVLILVFAAPLYLHYVQGFDIPPTFALDRGRPTATGSELLLLAACAVFGYALALRLRIPSARLVGPMVLSALAYLTGLVEGRPPAVLVATAQVVIGASVGARFVGLRLAELRRTVSLALVSGVAMSAGAAAVGAAAAPLLGFGPAALFLALAPGGLAEMSLIALAINADSAFVSSMHIVRIGLIVMLAPLAFHLLRWKPAAVERD